MACIKHLPLRILPFLCCLLLVIPLPLLAQVQQSDTTRALPQPRIGPPADTLSSAPPPPSPIASSPSGESDGLKNPINFTARDSLVLTFGDDNADKGALFGQVTIDYGDVKLNAHEIEILFDIDELRARGLPSDTGMVGRPTFNQGSETLLGNEMAFNLRTERGRIDVADTRHDEGQIRGQRVKLREDSTLFIANGVYTTCDCLDDPSYSLRSNRMKIIDQTRIFTGPIQLFLFNIPTPLWLPFGFLPAQSSRRSGLLAPTYGEDELGFYLRDIGWYFVLNDYTDLQLRGGLWTSGSWQARTLFRYNRRYGYSGQLEFDFARQRSGEKRDPDFRVRNTSRFRWSHNQTLNPSTTLTSNVNLSTAGYLRSVSERYDDRVSQTISSNIRFNKRWANTGRNLSLNASQRQVLDTEQASLSLPNLSFSQTSRKPFEKQNRRAGEDEKWYERITYSYNLSLDNRFDFQPLPEDTLIARNDLAATDFSWIDALFSIDKYQRATGEEQPFDFKASNRLPINATFQFQKINLNLTPNFSYTEDWYIQTNRRQLVTNADSTQRLETFTNPGFFALRQFSSSMSANTTIYGLFPLRAGDLNGLRHTLRPNLSFTYRPDFSSSFWGYYRSYVDQQGQEIEYPIVNGVQSGLQQALSLSLSNTFEAKQIRTDSTGNETSKILQLFNLDVNGSYNFAADSLRLSNISLSARTNIVSNLNINFRSTFSPYRLNTRLINAGTASEREISSVVDEFYFSLSDFRFARLTTLSMTANTSFRSKNGQPGRPAEVGQAQFQREPDAFGRGLDPTDSFGQSLGGAYSDYADFNIPWSLSLDVTYSLRKPLADVQRTFTLNSRFDFSLTPNWKVQGRSGFDFVSKEFVTTNLTFLRDFECWQMSLNWVPFGRYQSFGFNLQVKSGQLREFLRIRQPRSDVSGRFDGLL